MFDRTKINILFYWYKNVDIRILYLSIILIILGNFFVWIASPVVATRIGLSNANLFVMKNLIFSSISLATILILSFWNDKKIKFISFFSFTFLLLLMIAIVFVGVENKGAKRWIYIYDFSLQPSEIIKPFFAIVTAYLLTQIKEKWNIIFAMFTYIFIAILLILQPDLGMFLLITTTFAVELFLINIDYKYFITFGIACIIGILLLYLIFPHFKYRISTYIMSAFFGGEKSYQVEKSLDAFNNGGLIGVGLFEGTIKKSIPDTHTDFIFSIIGEEFGGMVCIAIVSLYFYIALRILIKATDINDNFKYISTIAICVQFLLQAFINIGVTLNILPTKGMTLPLISYGGSSMIGTAISIGFLLALTKKDYGIYHNETIPIHLGGINSFTKK
jgi:cell division protein FtsW